MEMIKKIYLDMDGVLVDLDAILEQYEGRTMAEVKEEINDDPYIFCMRKHMALLPFVNAPTMRDFHIFMKWIPKWQEKGIEVEILSSGSKQEDLYPEVIRQKQIWLGAHGLGHLKANFAKGASLKKLYADPFAVLVDDYIKNTNEFSLAGGCGAHYTHQTNTEQLCESLWKMAA